MDEARFRTEYKEVSDQLYTFLVRTAGNQDLAADILQEAAYRAYRSRKRFRGDSSFKTWIYRIAINALKNQRLRTRRETIWAETAQDPDIQGSPTPERLVSGRQEAAHLSRALELLEEGYRMPFLLKHVEGMSYSEISVILGIADSAARVRVHRARHTLRALLREKIP